MTTVFSHIIQKRFSTAKEDVATDALAYILQSSESARTGMMRLLRCVLPEIPALTFRTQQEQYNVRPDMWGYHDEEPRVYLESKFWAGMTDSQPCSYLTALARHGQPSVLLFVVPEARAHAIWHELMRRLDSAEIAAADRDVPSAIICAATTSIGPILAVTSWTRVLATLEIEAVDDPRARMDIVQLRSLCEAADRDAFVPISAEEATDQRVAQLVLQLGSVLQAAVDLAVARGILTIEHLRPTASWDRIGRYARFRGEPGAGVWIGIHFGLWLQHGGTPLWLAFPRTKWGLASEVRLPVESWAATEGILAFWKDSDLVVALDIQTGEDRDLVVREIVNRLAAIASVIPASGPRPAQ